MVALANTELLSHIMTAPPAEYAVEFMMVMFSNVVPVDHLIDSEPPFCDEQLMNVMFFSSLLYALKYIPPPHAEVLIRVVQLMNVQFIKWKSTPLWLWENAPPSSFA